MTLPAHLLIRRPNFVEIYLDDTLVRNARGSRQAPSRNLASLAQAPRDCLVLSPLDCASRRYHFTIYAKSSFLVNPDSPPHCGRHVALRDRMRHRSALRGCHAGPVVAKPFQQNDQHRCRAQ